VCENSRKRQQTMKNKFEQLVTALDSFSLSTDIIQQIILIFEQQTDESLSSFVSQSFQSLLTLQQWVWRLFSQGSHHWINEPYYQELFHTLALFNKKIIFTNDHIDVDTKASLLFSVIINQTNSIFEQIEQTNDDNDPFITIISLWLDNHSYFLHDNPEYNISSVIDHVGQYILQKYVMNNQYKLYLTQLRQPHLTQSIFTAKLLFYIKTCSFYTCSYLISKINTFPYSADEMIDYLREDYLQIIHVHSYTVASWNKELLGCIAHLVGFIAGCCWWNGQIGTQIKRLIPTEKITCDHVHDLIRIIGHKPFYQETKPERSNDETVLVLSTLMFLVNTVQKQNISWFFRSSTIIRDTIISVAEAALNDEICLCGYGILGETLTDDQLKCLKIADNICDYCFHRLEDAWNHSGKYSRKVPVACLLRGMLKI
jgi:hypothetical protein